MKRKLDIAMSLIAKPAIIFLVEPTTGLDPEGRLSAFVPTETMPKAVRIFAENQPVTSIVESVRSLLNAEPVGSEIWIALEWCVGITVVAWFFAIRLYYKCY